MKGDEEELIAQTESIPLERLKIVKVPELEGEFGFVTPVMMEGDYDTRAKRYKDQILHMIRIQD